jgi:hypothetical protein
VEHEYLGLEWVGRGEQITKLVRRVMPEAVFARDGSELDVVIAPGREPRGISQPKQGSGAAAEPRPRARTHSQSLPSARPDSRAGPVTRRALARAVRTELPRAANGAGISRVVVRGPRGYGRDRAADPRAGADPDRNVQRNTAPGHVDTGDRAGRQQFCA